ncbi:hypothetical protein R4681_17710 [Acinetobacter baumannii]|nr:hypothetical protein [Acinetobacter baumannii]
MSNKSYGLGSLMFAAFLPWFFLMTASGLFEKYKDNIQEPFNFAIKYGFIWAVILLGIAFIIYILSLHNPKLKVWIGTTFKMSLITLIFVLVVWYLRPEYSNVMERF